MKWIRFPFFILIFLSSCARHYTISTHSFSDFTDIPYGFAKGSTFQLFAQEPLDNPLFEKELSHKIGQMLWKKGYIPTEEKGDYALHFKIKSIPFTKTVNVPKYISGTTQKKAGKKVGSVNLSYEETTEECGKTIYVPEIWTYYDQEFTMMVYQDQKLLWTGSSQIIDTHNDLRDLLDYLLITSFRYFGQNSKKKIEIVMSEKDEELRLMRNDF